MIAAAHKNAQAAKTEEEELEELQGMIGGVPRGMYIKLREAQKNRDLADQVRREREEIAALREKRAQEQKERIDALRAKREQKQTEAKAAHRRKIEEIGQQVRQEVKELEQQKDLMSAEHWRQARVRVEVANGLDAKLDAAEEAQDQKERDDANAARSKFKADMAKAKEESDAYKHFLNEKVRTGRERRTQRMMQHAQTKRDRTRSTKADIRAWEESHDASRQAHLAHAREMAQKRAAERKLAKERNDARAAQRREAAREEKANNAVATEALAAEVRHNQLMRARSCTPRRRRAPPPAPSGLWGRGVGGWGVGWATGQGGVGEVGGVRASSTPRDCPSVRPGPCLPPYHPVPLPPLPPRAPPCGPAHVGRLATRGMH